MTMKTISKSFFLLFLVSIIILLSTANLATADTGQPDIMVHDEIILTEIKSPDGREGVMAKMKVSASLESAWDVMTDYNSLSDFIQDLKVSEVLENRNGEIILYQKGESGFLIFRFKVDVTLKVVEEYHNKIEFTQMTGDFDYFEGEWKVEPVSSSETLITYILIARPKFYAPKWVVKYMLRRDIPKRLKALQERIMKKIVTP